jgi:hypothetical protein
MWKANQIIIIYAYPIFYTFSILGYSKESNVLSKNAWENNILLPLNGSSNEASLINTHGYDPQAFATYDDLSPWVGLKQITVSQSSLYTIPEVEGRSGLQEWLAESAQDDL